MAQLEEIALEKKAAKSEEQIEETSLSSKTFDFIKELAVLVVTAFILAFIFKTLILQPFKVEMGSMMPTVLPNDRVLVNKFIYRFYKPTRGDVVTLYSPEKTIPDHSGFSIGKFLVSLYSSPRKILIKRIIATEGETIEMREGKVYINNKPIKEKYVKFLDYSGYGPITVPKDRVFVMGDNRPNSKDSRAPDIGPIKKSELLGKAIIVYWPPNAFKTF